MKGEKILMSKNTNIKKMYNGYSKFYLFLCHELKFFSMSAAYDM